MRALFLLMAAALPLAAQQTQVSGTAPAQARSRAASANAQEMLSLVNELRAREARLLRELAATPENEIGTRRSIEQQLARTAREAFAVMSVIEARCLEQRVNPPRGHLGVAIDISTEVNNGEVVRSQTTVASVEPGSPAATAGILAGDELIGIGGRNAATAIPRLGEILEPGRRIVLRVKRDGSERDIPVTVGDGTPRMDPACPEYERVVAPLRMGVAARVWVMDSVDGRGQRVVTLRRALPSPPPVPGQPSNVAPAPAGAVTATTPPPPPVPPSTPGVYVFGVTRGATGEFAYFNGAQLRQLDDDWRNVLGIRSGTEGVLVNEVAPGSAAAAAGLRSGDVIIAVDDTPAPSPLLVVRMLSLEDRTENRLRVIRARETRTVVMKRNPAPRN